MSFDWAHAELLRKFLPLEERRVSGVLACHACSFRFDDYALVGGVRIPNVTREVVRKTSGGFELACGHIIAAPLIWADEFDESTPRTQI